MGVRDKRKRKNVGERRKIKNNNNNKIEEHNIRKRYSTFAHSSCPVIELKLTGLVLQFHKMSRIPPFHFVTL
jgi:hypothetical protein